MRQPTEMEAVIITHLTKLFDEKQTKRPGESPVWQWLKQEGHLKQRQRGVPLQGSRVGQGKQEDYQESP
jgi:hypothetical protein